MRGADPSEVMVDLGFGDLHLQASFAVSMSGIHFASGISAA